MQRQPLAASQRDRIVAGLPFVEALARRMAATMPHSIDLGDLVQDGVIGLIDAAHRFDEARGIKFETFAERRVRGAMIDALRKDAWPRGVRRVRRELEAAREKLRRELGHEPSLADLAARVGSDEARSAGPSSASTPSNRPRRSRPASTSTAQSLPPALVPAEPQRRTAYEEREVRERVRAAIATLPARERKVIGLYYYGEVTMKEIGAEIGVNESRVSQLHARAIRRLREALGADCRRPRRRSAAPAILVVRADEAANGMAKADMPQQPGVVLPYKAPQQPATACAGRTIRARGCARRGRSRRVAVRGVRGRSQPRRRRLSASAAGPLGYQRVARGAQQVAQPERLGQPAAAASPRGSVRRRCRRHRR